MINNIIISRLLSLYVNIWLFSLNFLKMWIFFTLLEFILFIFLIFNIFHKFLLIIIIFSVLLTCVEILHCIKIIWYHFIWILSRIYTNIILIIYLVWLIWNIMFNIENFVGIFILLIIINIFFMFWKCVLNRILIHQSIRVLIIYGWNRIRIIGIKVWIHFNLIIWLYFIWCSSFYMYSLFCIYFNITI